MSQRKKILFISHDAELTGAPHELLLIVKNLNKSKYEPIVCLGKDGRLRKQFEQYAKVIVQDLFGQGRKYFRELKVVSKRIKFLRQLKPDLVYCNTIMTSKWMLYAKMLRLPTIIHVHELGYVFDKLSSLDRYLLHNFSDKCIAASIAVRKYLLTVCSLNPSKIVVFQENIEVPEQVQAKNKVLEKELFPDGCDIIVGTMGRVAHMKGTDLFVEAAKKIKENVPSGKKVKFLIVGGVAQTEKLFYEELETSIEMSGMENDVVITGFKENVFDYLSLIDIFVLSSREDPFPLVVLEAMSVGKPIVSFAVGGVPEALGQNSSILIKGLNVDAMKDAVLGLIQDPDRRNKMGAEARSRVTEDFNIVNNIIRIEEIIDSTIKLLNG